MCGIILAKDTKTIIDGLNMQSDRGLDSIGIIDMGTMRYYKVMRPESKKDTYNQNTKVWTYTPQSNAEALQHFETAILEWEKKYGLVGPYVFHHRKASMGAVTLENAHPYYFTDDNNSIFLMQNGTTKEFADYQKVASIYDPEYENKSDSWMLGKLIHQHMDKIPEFMDMSCGVKVLVDANTKRISIYGDQLRSFYVDKENSYFASEDQEGKEYNWKGILELDADFNIITEDYTQTKKTVATTYHYDSRAYATNYDDEYTMGGMGHHIHQRVSNVQNISKRGKKEKLDEFFYTQDEMDLIAIWLMRFNGDQKKAHDRIKHLRKCNGGKHYVYDPQFYPDPDTLRLRLRKANTPSKLECQLIKRCNLFHSEYIDDLLPYIEDNNVDKILEFYQGFYDYCMQEQLEEEEEELQRLANEQTAVQDK